MKFRNNESASIKNYSSDFYESFIEKYFNEWVVNYSDYYKCFNKIYLDDAEGKEISEIKTKLINYKNEIYKKYKNKSELLKALSNYIEQEYQCKNKEELNKAIKFIENLFNEINKNNNNNKDNINNLIQFPRLFNSDSNDERRDDEAQIIKCLIDYSESKILIRNIFNNNNKISSLQKLEEFPQMNYIFEIIFKYMSDWENNKNIKNKSMEQLDLILNSNLLYNLIQINPIYSKREKIIEILNKSMERKDITDDQVRWAYSMSINYHPSFQLIIPYLTPKDIIPLFTFRIPNESITEGLLFRKEDLNIFLSNAAKKFVFSKNFKN